MRFTREDSTLPDNPDQRIQEDLGLFTSAAVGLSMGLLNAAVTLASFVGILWGCRAASAFLVQRQRLEHRASWSGWPSSTRWSAAC